MEDRARVRKGLSEEDGVGAERAETFVVAEARKEIAGEERDLRFHGAALDFADAREGREDAEAVPRREVGLKLLFGARLRAQDVPETVFHGIKKHSARVNHSCDTPPVHPVGASRDRIRT